MEFNSLIEFLEHFKNEDVCRDYLIKQRWNDKPECPHCGSTKKMYRIEKGKRFKCSNKECLKKFSVKTGTIFENSNVNLKSWLVAIYLCTSRKKGVSSLQLSRDLGVTQKTAWFMLHRIRGLLKEEHPERISDTAQADETYVGGKEKNKHKNKRVPNSQGRSTLTKTPVFGLHSEGKVRTRVVPNTSSKTLHPIIIENITKGTILVTDEWKAYNNLEEYYQREVVNHRIEEYVNKSGFHTNSLEGYWSLFKRTILGTYHSISPKHLQRYSDESAYRYNTRDVSDSKRFNVTMRNTHEKLTYKMLTE